MIATDIVAAFHATSQLSRRDVFGESDELMPAVAQADAVIPSPGWVGADWQPGGSLLMGINPGGGTDAYRRNTSDDQLYAALRDFRAASDANAQTAALAMVTDVWIRAERTHAIWLLIGSLLKALATKEAHTAFMNLVPFRTRENRMRTAIIDRAWQRAAKPQIDALRPSRIFALGSGVYRALCRFEHHSYELIELPRTNGDRYIAPRSREVLQGLLGKRLTTAHKAAA